MGSGVKEAMERVDASAQECIDNGDPVVIEMMSPGHMQCQGDVGVLRLDGLPPHTEVMKRPQNGQIAPGTNKGSRHCVDEMEATVTYYRVNDGDMLSDIAIESDGPWALRHPEHADCTFMEAGTYRFLHQQNEAYERIRD
jgi:hypothetical protein